MARKQQAPKPMRSRKAGKKTAKRLKSNNEVLKSI
jgi:hypothetical protein